jgi:hypothetical protein
LGVTARRISGSDGTMVLASSISSLASCSWKGKRQMTGFCWQLAYCKLEFSHAYSIGGLLSSPILKKHPTGWLIKVIMLIVSTLLTSLRLICAGLAWGISQQGLS